MVSLRKEDDVARYQLLSGKSTDLVFAENINLLREEFAKGGQGLLDPVLLPKRKYAADKNHDNNGTTQPGHSLAGREPLSDKSRPRRHPKNKGKEMGKLLEEAHP